MPRPTTEERLRKIHYDALLEFDEIQTAYRDERMQCLQDRRFYSIAGSQWEGSLGEQFQNKPKFEVNKIHLAVIRIINEYRNNRISISFVPKKGETGDKLADTCAGLYRSDEKDSSALEAYDNAFEEAVGGGMGAWRLRAKEEDEYDPDNEEQRVCFEPITDADSCVFFDANARRQDKSDATKCFVLTPWSPRAYEDEYDDDPTSWDKAIHQVEFDWCSPDVVYVAELYIVERKRETIHVYRTLGDTEVEYTDDDLEETPDLIENLAKQGTKEIRQRKVRRRKVHKYILSGNKVLEDCSYIAGPNIPIVPVYGKRWVVDNIERCSGHVRLCKDIQRLKNMQLSKLGEISALSSVEKPILFPEEIAGFQDMWSDDTVKNFPYMLLNRLKDLNGLTIDRQIQYTRSPTIPLALAELLQITEQDMQDMLGKQEQGEQLQPNVSGLAIELVQSKLDMQTFIYISNMEKAVHRSAEIWLGMARDILVEEGRKMKTLDPAGKASQIELMQPMYNPDGGEDGGVLDYANDMSKANFDVEASVGPPSASKRAATVRSLMGMLGVTQDPETQQVLGSMIMMNIEGEGIDDVRDFFRGKLLKMGVVKPTDEEAKDMAKAQAAAPPDPQVKLAEAVSEQAVADAVKARADAVLSAAKAEESRAKAAATLVGIDQSHQKQAMDLVNALGNAVQQDVETAKMRTEHEQLKATPPEAPAQAAG